VLRFERDIPIPPESSARRGRPSIGWEDMQVGDSVLLSRLTYKQGRSRVAYLSHRYGYKCVMRMVEGGVRIWRRE